MSKRPYRILIRRKGAGGIQIWNDGGNGSVDGNIDQFYVWYDLAIAKQDSGRIAHNFDAPASSAYALSLLWLRKGSLHFSEVQGTQVTRRGKIRQSSAFKDRKPHLVLDSIPILCKRRGGGEIRYY